MKKAVLLLGLILVSCSKDSGDDSPTPEPLKFTLTVSAGEGGSVDTAGGTYNEGTTVTVTATPDAEYLFNNWSGTESSTNNPLNIVLTSNENVTANFVKKQYELAITIEGEGTVEEVVTQQGKEYASGTEVELTAVAAEGWQFSGWSGDIESTDNPILVTVDEAKDVTATFIRKSYELTVNITGEGTVTEEVITAPSQYEFETELRLTAEPSQYWQFVGWSGDVESTDNPITFTIDKAYNLDATFELLDSDGDGYTDDVDQCPDTAAGAVVDENGCSDSQKDSDGDGYTDDVDQCPDTAAGAVVDENGCSDSQKDSDFDGVTDDVDQCPDTSFPDRINGTVDENGCGASQRDSDGDGVVDSIDQDNSTREGVPVDENGVMLNPIYLDENGVTIKVQEWGIGGDIGVIDGVEYTIIAAGINFPSNGKVCTSLVTDMSGYFYFSDFNGDISNWDVSNVTNMSNMFRSNFEFNGDISIWDVSNVTDMSGMFQSSLGFNQDISGWDVSNVTNMESMFSNILEFNQDISGWNVSNVTNMESMFHDNDGFNQDLSGWDVSNVTSCSYFSFSTNNWTLPKPNFTNCDPN